VGKRFWVWADRCTGCQLCVIACRDEHAGNPYPPWTQEQAVDSPAWIRVESHEQGRLPRVRVTHLPIFCQHCEHAPCMQVCPHGAIARRPDGLVWIDAGRCDGCGLCQAACPYDVIVVDRRLGVAQKCTGCAHRVDHGEMPRCVEICPHMALAFGEEDATGDAQERGEILHPEFQARPRVHWHGLPRPWIAGQLVQKDADEVLAGATVTVHDLFTDQVRVAVSDAFGTFWVRDLEEGHRYQVTITMPGFAPVVLIVPVEGAQDLGEVTLARA
jgi:tetrathionate reductase subunit B